MLASVVRGSALRLARCSQPTAVWSARAKQRCLLPQRAWSARAKQRDEEDGKAAGPGAVAAAPLPPSFEDGGPFSPGARLLFWVEKPMYFMGLSALSGMQLGYWAWFQYMEAYHPIQQTAETAAMAVTNPLWGQVGFLSGAMFVGLVRFFAGNYMRRVALSPERTHLEYTVHTMLGGESSKLHSVPLSALSTLPKGKQFYSISVVGKKTFLLLDQAGNFVDEPALLSALNIGGKAADGGADDSDDKASAAAANARLKLEQLAASTTVQADINNEYTTHKTKKKKRGSNKPKKKDKDKRR